MASKYPHPDYHRPKTNPTVDVVCTIADLENTSVSDLPLLRDAINPDALNKFIDSTDHGEIMFEYAGYQIVVTADGEVSVDSLVERSRQ